MQVFFTKHDEVFHRIFIKSFPKAVVIFYLEETSKSHCMKTEPEVCDKNLQMTRKGIDAVRQYMS